MSWNVIFLEREEVFGHLILVYLVVNHLACGCESLELFACFHLCSWTVVKKPVTLFHALEWRLLSVTYLAESAIHSEENMLFGHYADPVSHHISFHIDMSVRWCSSQNPTDVYSGASLRNGLQRRCRRSLLRRNQCGQQTHHNASSNHECHLAPRHMRR